MYESFFKNILKREDHSGVTEKELLWMQNLKLMKISVLVVLAISLYWIVADKILETYNLSDAALCAVAAQIVSGIYLFILIVKSKEPNYKLIRYSFLIYYIIMIVSVGILTYSRNLNIISEGSFSPHIGISISTFYLFTLAIIPMPDRKDDIFLCIIMCICLVGTEIIAHTSDYSLLSHFILCVCFTLLIMYDRDFFLKNFRHEIEISALTDELTMNSMVDSLTGALNRRAMDEYLEYLENKPEVSCAGVIFFDIDYFKSYNDYYGHVQGDRALEAVVKTVTDTLEGLYNVYLYRYGGEEFVVIMENVSESELINTMIRIKDDIYNANIPREDIDIFDRITITTGGAIEETPSETGDYVLAADSQLYLGKARYRNAVYFDNTKVNEGSSFSRNIRNKLSRDLQSKAIYFESRFEKAIDNKEFVVWCQPQFDASENFVLGGEALVRWIEPDGTILSPGEFIPIFESDGRISILDEYVFRYVCRQQREILERGLIPVPVSVNMSRATLFNLTAIKTYQKIIDETGIPKHLVPLEITESTEADSELIAKLTHELKNAGFSIYMDDFGSGYFSLSNLSELPFDSVKLDKSLIDNIGNEKGDEVLKHIVELAHFLKMKVVAEGVELKEQLNFVRKLNCDIIQGYYFSKPVPFEEYLHNLTSQKAQMKIAEYNARKDKESIDIGSLRVTNEMKLQYLSALGNIYMTMHVIDLDQDTTIEFTTTVNVKEHVNQSGNATEQIKQAMIHTVAPEHIPYVLDFTDLTTLKERMRGKRSISREFIGVHFGWFRAQFIVISADEEEIPHTVMYTTQVITADKENERKLLVECRTDERTGVYNNRAFIEDSAGYNEEIKKTDSEYGKLALMHVNTLGLKETNSRLGHTAGDELLWGTTECLTRVFGKDGRIYRTDNSEFTVVFDEDKFDIQQITKKLNRAVDDWMGNNVKKLNVNFGCASISEYPGSTIEELDEKAKERAAQV